LKDFTISLNYFRSNFLFGELLNMISLSRPLPD